MEGNQYRRQSPLAPATPWGRMSLVRKGCSLALLAALSTGLLGCQQDGVWSGQQQASNLTPQQQQQLAQLQELQQRAGQLDNNNDDLHARLAESQRTSNVLQQHIDTLNAQLADTTEQLNQSRRERDEYQEQFTTLQASVRRRGGAVITPNNGVEQQLTAVEVAGIEVRQDGLQVRMDLPSDQIFVRGSTNLTQQGIAMLDAAGDAIARNYPRNQIGIEGHVDTAGVAAPWTSEHQLTAAQATAVFTYLTQSGRLRADGLSVMGHGSARPITSNGTMQGRARNRRIELVIYPETRR